MNTSQHHIPNQDAYKSPERLEEEVNQTRARIGERLETLSNRLSPGELLDQVLGMAREHGGEFTRNLGTQMKNNPVPLIITGIGMSWLMMAPHTRSYQGGRRIPYASGYNDGYSPRYPEGVSEYPYNANRPYANPDDYERPMSSEHSGAGVVDKARDAMEKVGDQVEHLKDSAKEKMERVSETIHENIDGMHHRMHAHHQHQHFSQQRMRSAQECMTDFFQEQPVLAASLGVALGAAIGALLPATEVEDKLMGSVGEQAVNKAQNLASEQYEKVRETAKEVAENVKDNIRDISNEQAAADKRNSDGVASQSI